MAFKALDELVSAVRELNRADKLRLMQVIVNELALEENAVLIPGAEYEVWSPYDSADAAQTLLAMLDADKKTHDGQ